MTKRKAKTQKIIKPKVKLKGAGMQSPWKRKRQNYQRNILYAIIAAVFIFFITFRAINISVERQLKVQVPDKSRKKEVLSSQAPSKPVVAKASRKEKSSDIHSSGPEEYNIMKQKQGGLPQNERRWNSSTRKVVRDADIIDRMSEGEAFKGVKKTPEQFQEQLRRIEGRIREYEQRLQNDPGDDYARQKLQGLYMLKATVQGLKKAVVEK